LVINVKERIVHSYTRIEVNKHNLVLVNQTEAIISSNLVINIKEIRWQWVWTTIRIEEVILIITRIGITTKEMEEDKEIWTTNWIIIHHLIVNNKERIKYAGKVLIAKDRHVDFNIQMEDLLITMSERKARPIKCL